MNQTDFHEDRQPSATATSGSAQELSTVPAARAPSVVPPIEGFEKLLTAVPPLSQTTPNPAAEPPNSAEPLAAASSAASASSSVRPRPPGARRVPPPGVFSLRSTAPVLLKTPSAKKGERELDPAGWDAAAYPFDAPVERDLELDAVINELIRDIEADETLNGLGATSVSVGADDNGQQILEDDTDRASVPSPESLSKSPSLATTAAPPHVGAGQTDSENILPHRTSPPRPKGSPSKRAPSSQQHAAHDRADSDRHHPVVDSPASDRWNVLSPPRQDEGVEDNREDSEEALVVHEPPLHPQRDGIVSDSTAFTEMRESTPVSHDKRNSGKKRVETSPAAKPPAVRPRPGTAGKRQGGGLRNATVPFAFGETDGRHHPAVRAAASTTHTPHGSRERREDARAQRATRNAGAADAVVVPPRKVSPPAGAAAALNGGCKRKETSYADPTSSWEHRVTEAVAQTPEESNPPPSGNPAAAAEPPKTEEGTTAPGEFHLATAERMSAAEARRKLVEQRKRQEAAAAEQKKKRDQAEHLQRVRKLSAAPKPRGYDAIAEQGRRKRQLLDEAERQRRLEMEGNLTFQPKISELALAKKKSTDKEGGISRFLAANAEWNERRERHLAQEQRRRQEEEEAERRRRFVNAETERIVQRKRGDATAAEAPVFERLISEAARKQEAQKKLEEKYTPSFQPDVKRSPSRTPERVRSAGPEPTGGASNESKATSTDYFENLYEQSVQRRAQLERQLEKKREEQYHRSSGTDRVPPKRSEEEIQAFIAQMEARDAERRARFEQEMQRRRETEAAAAPQIGKTSLVDPYSAKIASRGRERIEIREAQKQRAKELAEQQKRKEAEAAAERSALRTPARLSPSFEAHELRSEERRAHNLGRLRQELLEREMAECTFKPQVCPASEDLARRVRYSNGEDDEYLAYPDSQRGPQDMINRFREAAGSAGASPSHGPLSLSTSMERPVRPTGHDAAGSSTAAFAATPTRTPAVRSVVAHGSDASPVPRRPRPRMEEEESPALPQTSSSQRPPRSTASLEQEIESLEEVLKQWKQMEEEVAG